MPEKKKRQQINKEELRKKLEEDDKKIIEPTERMGAKLKQLLKNEIEEYKKREKTRVAEMLSIFSAHNFYSNGLTPVEMRTTLEDLGPTYVKIGQIMSSRPDLLPESYCKELEKLRQTVKPLAPEIVRAIIEDETGKKIEDIYSEFRDEPLGSASIGQVHYCVLKDGTKVVTKVQRPMIAESMVKDFVLLKKLAGLVNIVSDFDEGDQTIDLLTVIEELEKVSMQELDFRIEAENTKFFKENCIEDEEVISCPTVYDELTTKRIFTMSYIDGYSVSKKDRIIEDGYDPEKICTAIVNSFVYQMLDVGTFHADPHQGNIMVSKGKPYWIDFGMMGHLSENDIDMIQKMVLAALGSDTESLIDTIMIMGIPSEKTDRDKMTKDVEVFLMRFKGVTSVSEVNVSAVFTDIMDLASKHHIQMPGTFTMFARAIIAIEGVIEQLCPELNLINLLSKKLADRVKKNFDLKKTLTDAGKSLLNTTKKITELPGLAAEALAAFAKGKMQMKMEITGIDEPLTRIGKFVKNIMLIIVACVMFIGGCILSSVDIQPKTSTGMPLLSAILMTVSVGLGIYAIRKLGN